MPASPHELAEPQPTQHKLELNDIVLISSGAEQPGVPEIMGVQPMATLEIGGGRPENTQTLHLLKITDTARGDYREFAARAEASGVETSDYVLAAMYEGEDRRIHVDAMTFLPRDTDVIIGREPGHVAWFQFGVDKGNDPRQWTPFRHNSAVSRKQFGMHIPTVPFDRVSIDGLSVRSQTVVEAPDMKVVRSTAAERAETSQADPAAPRRTRAAQKLARRALRRG